MVKKTKTTKKTKMKSKSKKTKSKSAKNSKNVPLDNNVIVFVVDDLTIDTEKEIEVRRAYLEEAGSQESSD